MSEKSDPTIIPGTETTGTETIGAETAASSEPASTAAAQRHEEVPSVFLPERRTGLERRSGADRRDGEERRSGVDRRRGAVSVRHALATVAASVGELAENASPIVSAVADKATEAGSAVVHKAGDAVGAVVHAAGSAATPITSAAGGRRAEAARLRELRASARRPLPSLWEEHPEARRASLRELGVQTVPLDKIRGTAVAGSTQRGGDFLPLRGLRGANWEGRWQRIRRAVDTLQTLPPVDLMKYGDEYWVVDGHNRVGAAKYAGQVGIDASVVELRTPGMPRSQDPGLVGELLAEQRKFQAEVGASRRPGRRPRRPPAEKQGTEPGKDA
jgi:hypothetical protein